MRARKKISGGSVMLAAAFLVACSTERITLSQPQEKTTGFTIIGDRSLVTRGDIEDVVHRVHRIAGAAEPVVFIHIENRNTITVLTGHIDGPLAGGGDSFVFRRRAHGWRWDGNRGAWNA